MPRLRNPRQEISMKNQKAMYAIAKARALSLGPRKFKRIAGYALTDKELNETYLLEGFAANKKAMNAHVEIWNSLGMVSPVKIGDDGAETVYFFSIDDSDSIQVMKALTAAYPEYIDEKTQGVLVV